MHTVRPNPSIERTASRCRSCQTLGVTCPERHHSIWNLFLRPSPNGESSFAASNPTPASTSSSNFRHRLIRTSTMACSFTRTIRKSPCRSTTYHAHFESWYEFSGDHATDSALEFIRRLIGEEVAVVSWWQGEQWRGSVYVEANEPADVPSWAKRAEWNRIRVRSWNGTYNSDRDA